MSMQKKLKVRGLFMLVSFLALLGIIFTPIFPGNVNGLDYMDGLFNQISKGSSYFIPDALAKVGKSAGQSIDVKIKMASDKEAADTAKLFTAGGAQVAVNGAELAIKGDVSQLMKVCLEDSDRMFKNEGQAVADKYGMNEKQALYNWWNALSKISKDLTRQNKFDQAKVFDNLQKKAVEPAYNYYGVKAEKWNEKIFMVIACLAFYVFYTLWYGFGLMYMFEGLGYKIGH